MHSIDYHGTQTLLTRPLTSPFLLSITPQRRNLCSFSPESVLHLPSQNDPLDLDSQHKAGPSTQEQRKRKKINYRTRIHEPLLLLSCTNTGPNRCLRSWKSRPASRNTPEFRNGQQKKTVTKKGTTRSKGFVHPPAVTSASFLIDDRRRKRKDQLLEQNRDFQANICR